MVCNVFLWDKRGLTAGLELELKRRKNAGEKLFEYFASTCAMIKEVDGKMVATTDNMLYNYFFVHTTEDDLFEIKRHQPQYSVMCPKTNSDGTHKYPFISDSTIRTLQWVAEEYGGRIPICLRYLQILMAK